jgi:hypothetical protein
VYKRQQLDKEEIQQFLLSIHSSFYDSFKTYIENSIEFEIINKNKTVKPNPKIYTFPSEVFIQSFTVEKDKIFVNLKLHSSKVNENPFDMLNKNGVLFTIEVPFSKEILHDLAIGQSYKLNLEERI